jgi:hypothetical protein
VYLQWVICTQANVQTDFEEGFEGITIVGQEQCIIAQGTHSDADLPEVEEVL